jgi:hypothetical protein
MQLEFNIFIPQYSKSPCEIFSSAQLSTKNKPYCTCKTIGSERQRELCAYPFFLAKVSKNKWNFTESFDKTMTQYLDILFLYIMFCVSINLVQWPTSFQIPISFSLSRFFTISSLRISNHAVLFPADQVRTG